VSDDHTPPTRGTAQLGDQTPPQSFRAELLDAVAPRTVGLLIGVLLLQMGFIGSPLPR
jgi:hypothetical protein